MVYSSYNVCYTFQSTPSLRKVTSYYIYVAIHQAHFNPHLPCGRWLGSCCRGLTQSWISIHTFLAEGDKRRHGENHARTISIHTFLAEGDSCFPLVIQVANISIHTFLAEGDDGRMGNYYGGLISIHTFLAEGDRKNIYNYFFIMHIFMHYILSYL